MLPGPIPGLVEDGNIDLYTRPLVPFQGNYATVRSTSFSADGKEVLIPTVINNRVVLNVELAIRYALKHHQWLGIFSNVRYANLYAERLHEQQARIYCLT